MNDTPFAIPVAHSHDLWLVIVSVFIAMVASYTALELTGRVTAMRGSGRFNWLIAGAGIMGSGIWSMHFTAMLGFQIPLPSGYCFRAGLVHGQPPLRK
jgi:NO-binding membrane sensor protein with MHYT domain